MTRIEEATNKIIEFIDIVKDVPKNESILAIGLDMVEWADKTMLDKVCEWLKGNLPYSAKPPYQLIEDLRKAMEE